MILRLLFALAMAGCYGGMLWSLEASPKACVLVGLVALVLGWLVCPGRSKNLTGSCLE